MSIAWVRVGLFYFLSIAIIGTLMRFSFMSDLLPFLNYKNLLHTHSHIAFLGWVYSSLFLASVTQYFNQSQIKKGKFNLQFILTQIVIAWMFLSFLIQGYSILSIASLTIFQFLSYWFIYSFFKTSKSLERSDKESLSLKFIKLSLISHFISSLGTWGLAIVNAKGLGGTELYSMAIYFYLHFEYNGLFTFGILGLLIRAFEKNSFNYSKNDMSLSFKLFALTLIPSYLLSLLGTSFSQTIQIPALIIGLVQGFATFLFIKAIYKAKDKSMDFFNNYIKALLSIAIFSFVFKTVLQVSSAIPLLSEMVFSNRFMIISYIHLVMIGFISIFLIAYFSYLKWFDLSSKLSKVGIGSLLLGFIGSEIFITLFSLNLIIPDLLFLIFIFSALMMIGLGIFFIAQFKINGFNKIPLEPKFELEPALKKN